jgi:hypothetical protein
MRRSLTDGSKLGRSSAIQIINRLSQELAAEMLPYYDEAVHSLDAVGVDPIHIYDLATSKVAADKNIAGPILSLANPNATASATQ